MVRTAIACICLIGFIIANVCGVQITGRLQNGFMFFFWGVAVIWFLTMIPNVQLPNFVQAPDFMGDLGVGGFIAAVAMIWWCFAGFETCCAMGLRKKMPELKRPFKVRGLVIGAPVSMIIYVVMMTQLEPDAIITGIVWCVLGLVIFFACTKVYGKSTDYVAVPELEEPSGEERAKMDREFHIWIAVTAVAAVAALGVYLIPML